MKLPLKITLLVVGKPKKSFVREGVEIYLQRLKHYLVGVEVVAVKDSGLRNLGEALREEGRRLLKIIPPEAHVIVLDERGQEVSSVEFSAMLRQLAEEGKRHIFFVIGGAYGLAPEVKKRARQTLALSRLTLPHDLALLLVTEQIYRAMTIISGEGYHH
ncbi:23S rRNA (pseudouridine(1915)-N(3))-methyltransferase RlmH [Thermosulfuriphilus ammonigenes]|uniref:Ribosomal RNA large subunit methyltransferase H n=1 Tax=Thermosulfuriphilus ammonigenes TaxID=1936021 RepID=A0A6G7PVG0_9BACT|nr:23S rRNA (pseudouridine(1915)-N(3))-methyltransferase RlmH [Thermosulfuriphilus ammonigenes]MBA2848295.1 23S rRNA (pseudouridine1915-N3)-methyltransferase [Thermosulfuriphilus ammonigenes]QIJ71546.1 23S rRNA (pseudouridine(1915)-N(3))-methyltransferase RlmH [Thermosulfuriphilus ammonigenes]